MWIDSVRAFLMDLKDPGWDVFKNRAIKSGPMTEMIEQISSSNSPEK